ENQRSDRSCGCGFYCRRVISDSRRRGNLPGGFDHARDFSGEREFAEGEAGDAELAEVAARTAAERAAVADAGGGGILRQLLKLFLRGEELLVGGGGVGEGGFELGALGLVFVTQALALLVAFDGGSFRHGNSRWLKGSGGGGGLGRLGPAEGHAEKLEQLAALVVGGNGGHEGDVEAHRLLDVFDRDLGKN